MTLSLDPSSVHDVLTVPSIRKLFTMSLRLPISYQIPTFTLKGNLVHFAAYKKHVGFYPTSSGIRAFRRELSTYDTAKGTVRFPIDKPLPLKLIGKIVKFRVAENLKNAEIRSRRRK